MNNDLSYNNNYDEAILIEWVNNLRFTGMHTFFKIVICNESLVCLFLSIQEGAILSSHIALINAVLWLIYCSKKTNTTRYKERKTDRIYHYT